MNNLLHIESAAAWENRAQTVLLVEDEEFVRNVTGETLEASGYRVLAAGDGMEALRVYEEFGPEICLLLTDMILPGENGGQLAARMRRKNPDLRVLLVTGYADQIAVLTDSGEEYLLKPFCSDVLLKKIAALMDTPRMQSGQAEPLMRACAGA